MGVLTKSKNVNYTFINIKMAQPAFGTVSDRSYYELLLNKGKKRNTRTSSRKPKLKNPERFIRGVLPVVDNHSILTVHSFLESPSFTQPETISATEEDVFQCGKCKKQFTSISMFINHKKECSNIITLNPISSAVQNSVSSGSQSTVIVQKIQVPSSPLSAYTQNVVFADTDMLSLAGSDAEVITSVPSTPSIQISADDAFSSQSRGVTIQQVIPQISTLSPLQQMSQPTNAVEVPLLNNKLISGPLFLMSQPPNGNSSISGYVLNISNPAIASIDANNSELLENAPPPKAHVVESNEVSATCDSAVTDKNLSTVNVITEFHSSMVKMKKKTSENECEEISKKDQKLNCAYCSKSFSKNFDLQQHIRCHTGEKPFQCIVCGRAFAQKSNVKKHMHTHKVWPDGLSHTLPPLQKKDDFPDTNEGKSKEGNDKHFYVDNESEVNDSSCDMSESSYACPYCSYVGKTYYKLKSHMKQHEKKKVYKCIVSTCGLMFHDLDPFLEHIKSHENEMTYQCHECSKNFPSLYDLGAHQYTHSLYPNQRPRTPKRFFRCSMCLNKYSTPAALNHHISTSPHVYSCHYCDKVFPCERYLRRHLRIHTGSESFVCKYCNKGFKTEHYLKVHMLIHSDNKPFDCKLCKAAFNRKDKLKRHMLIHEPVKRFKCPFRSHSGCIKEFNRPDKLKAHILTHSCIKPYMCKACGKSFTRFAHLRNHVKIHNDSESASENCQFCGEKLNDSEEHWCSALKQQRAIARKFRFSRSKKAKKTSILTARRKCQEKRQAKVTICRLKENGGSNEEILGDIPTAHIEIISTNGEFIGNGNITHITLPQAFQISHVEQQFDQSVIEASSQRGSPILAELQVDASNVAECTELYEPT